ncbi:MAG: magnesium-translocating P-type ATPase [Acidobacteriota bacterium]
MDSLETDFWSKAAVDLLRELESGPGGLAAPEAARRLERFGPNRLAAKRRTDDLGLLLGQFKSPIILILLFAAGLSYALHDRADALIILFIILVSGLLGFWQERGAAHAVETLLATVQNKANVFRDGSSREVPFEDVVPGDVALLAAGSSIPGDCLILESRDLFVDEAALTGETYPVEKSGGVIPGDTPLGRRTNSLFMGTHVVSGTARALVVRTGRGTEFGGISERLVLKPQETEFERGVRRFGYLLMEVTLIMLITIFAVNVYLHRPALDSFMFALALAVGLTPQLLPAIISVNLAHGARRMAGDRVIVKRLASIENLGSMNVLCSDKTGTLTEGVVRLYRALDVSGADSEKVLHHAYLNASFETGFANPIDDAIRLYRRFDLEGYEKLDEVPYDFVRKRLSILVSHEGRRMMITKGALANVLEVCSAAEGPNGTLLPIDAARPGLDRLFRQFSADGYRVLGLACRQPGEETQLRPGLEAEMTLLGLLVFHDPPKPEVSETIRELAGLGVALKIITGDNHLVADSVGRSVGLADPKILTGAELRHLSDDALMHQAGRADIFAEVEPNQKERILLALKKQGNVVGYMGDGINDASALHAADVSISVEGGVDVAKEAADIVLLERDLRAVVRGVRDGRKTFANTLKYVFMATSANFGNMFSMACASLVVPFLPLLPKQILLINLMTDFPEMTIATDTVDPEMVLKPRRWDVKFIRNFMFVFGMLSSTFDFLTFAVLLIVLHARPELFRTGWFLESVISATLIVLVIRSRRPCFKSRPSRYLLTATALVVAAALILPWTPIARGFGFEPVPLSFLAAMGTIVVAYVIAAEVIKSWFFRWAKF